MCPASRPMTSSTMTRLWLAAVTCRRSTASVATSTAVLKPIARSVWPRSLSMVLGMPTRRQSPSSARRRRIARLPSPPTPISASSSRCVIAGRDLGRTVDRARWPGIGERIAAIGRAQQGAAHGQDAGHQVRGQRDRVDRPRQQAVGGLADAEHFPAVAEHGALDHRPDHRIEAGAVATAGQQAETQPASPGGPAAMLLHIGG